MIWRLLKSDSFRSAVGFAAGGAGFAVGNILLAQALSPDSFGVVTLVLALNQFGVTFGPFGLEVVANRHRPRVGLRLGALSVVFAFITALIAAGIAIAYYHLSAGIAMLLLAMVMGSATGRVCVALFQGEHQLRRAMVISQASNYVLLAAAVTAIVLSVLQANFVVACMAAGYVGSSIVGWSVARRTVNTGRAELNLKLALHEGAAALGIGVGVEILSQFERLAIPKVGSMQMLGTYAVLAAVAGSPFRMIKIGTSFSLLPRLRAVTTAAAARAVLWREILTASFMSLVSSIIIVSVAPFVFDRLLHGKYVVGSQLIVASIIVGLAKVWEGFSTTITSALGSPQILAAISVLAWLCLAIAVAAILYGARYGLLGILYAVGAAWVLLAVGGSYLGLRSFRARFAQGVT